MDPDSRKNYLIDCETGTASRVDYFGEPIKRYHASVTGIATYRQREVIASLTGLESLRASLVNKSTDNLPESKQETYPIKRVKSNDKLF